MKIPGERANGGADRLQFYRDTIDACFYSRTRRIQQYELLQSYYLYGVPPLKPEMPPAQVPGVPEITEEERAADVHPAAIAGPVPECQGEHSYLIDADVSTLRPLVRQLETMREEMGPASSAALDCLLRLIS